jgi:hypothetical protein
MLAFAAEGAIQQLAVVVTLPSNIGHLKPLLTFYLVHIDGGNTPTLQVRHSQCIPALHPGRLDKETYDATSDPESGIVIRRCPGSP